MEKVIIGIIKLVGYMNIRVFRQLHRNLWGGSCFVLVLMVLLLWLSYEQGGM